MATTSSLRAATASPGLVRLAPGLAVCLALAVAGLVVAAVEERLLGHAPIEGLVIALLLGVAVRNLLAAPAPYLAGANFMAKHVLEFAVALLGISVDARTVLAAGPALLGLVAVGVASSLAVSFSVGRALGLAPHLAILVSIGNSICGNSAIAALAPAIGARKQDVASAIALTAILGLTVVLLLPLTIPLLGLSFYEYGVLAGMSVYAVPQVLAATLPVGDLSTTVGTLVKLVRVVLLGPSVLVLAVLFHRFGPAPSDELGGPVRRGLLTYVPWFVLTFLVLAALRSVGAIPAVVADPVRTVSGWLTVLAMAGLGMGVELAAVRRVGPRVGVAVILSLAFMIGLVLTLIHLFGL